MDSIKSEVKYILDRISNLEIRLNSIRSICKHPIDHINIENIKDNGGVDLRRVCDVCKKTLGYPSKSDIDNWIS